MKVVLIGFSGTGKSSVGARLAETSGWGFVDTDQEIEKAAGKPIHRIFAEEGEEFFRRLEAEAVGRALEGPARVVAVGGGAILDARSRQLVRSGNLVVLLEARVETIQRRLAVAGAEEPRPLLRAADPRARIEELKLARDPIYREAADIVVYTDGDSVDEIAVRVAGLVRPRFAASSKRMGEGA